MSEDEISECRELGRMIADIETKLSYWQRQRETAERLVDKLSERQGILLMRQKALLEGKAKGAAG